MEEGEETSSPFWLEKERRGLRRWCSVLPSVGAVVVCMVVMALAFTLVLLPTLQSFTSHVLKPHSVKKSWDSLNLVLVLFAVLCAFLSRKTDETPPSYEHQSFSDTTQEYEYEYSDRMQYKSYNRLRSFNSYPDLRQESPWIVADERWRFYDDTHVNGYRGLEQEENRQRRPVAGEEEGMKNIEVDSFVAKEVPGAAAEKRRSGKNKSGRESASKELLTALKGKKKKQRQRSVENFQRIPNSEPSTFHNLFSSEKNKHTKINSVSPTSRHHVSSKTVKPRLSNKREDFYALEENVIAGNESPLIPIPPPPPPPFKMPAWKFRVQGDFVRVDSISSSSSGSPDLDDQVVDSPMGEDGGEGSAILLVYPNPDVDTKADTFIENFRAGLRIEKINSTNEKQGIRRSKSNLDNSSFQRKETLPGPSLKPYIKLYQSIRHACLRKKRNNMKEICSNDIILGDWGVGLESNTKQAKDEHSSSYQIHFLRELAIKHSTKKMYNKTRKHTPIGKAS
ncbi:hypothetical protein VNO77_29175 [Canavalia gladiata]|uniref:Uncharacterized protein n=1 Tax=Canavalia gladiata TaxID=3824 RepID=A0AAN9Q7N8_CANGL